MVQVTVVDFTGVGKYKQTEYAARLLAFTKNTRLQMTPDGFNAWLEKPWSEIEPEMAYMANTIPSSWEFVNFTFSIEGVTRACAQQITRTRYTPMEMDVFGSYAMQSQRVTDMSEVVVTLPELNEEIQIKIFKAATDVALNYYQDAVDEGMPLEDARGILPMNTQCNLVVQYNLRAMAELFRKRESLRVQGEFVDIVRQMRAHVERIWPWSAPFFVPKDSAAIALIEEASIAIRSMLEHGGKSIHFQGKTLEYKDLPAQLAKAADLIKGV